MNLEPLGDRIIVEAIEEETTTSSGIIMPDISREKPVRGLVTAVGEGRWENGERLPMGVVVGDTVIYSKFGGTDVKIEGNEFLILRESDVLARVLS